MFSPFVTTLQLILVFLSLLETLTAESQTLQNKEFYDACAHGDFKRVRELLDGNSGE